MPTQRPHSIGPRAQTKLDGRRGCPVRRCQLVQGEFRPTQAGMVQKRTDQKEYLDCRRRREKDRTSGMRDATASFAAQRKYVEGLAHIIFSSNPKQVRFWLGKESVTVEELESQYDGCKPCMHGSDAHSVAKAGQPDEGRRCWLKGDLTFDSLRQACIEPDERVFIGTEPPRGALDSHTITSVYVSNAPWIANGAVGLNAGLVAVIGARGSGKTALADLIAAGGLALSPHLNEHSFILRAKPYLGSAKPSCNGRLAKRPATNSTRPTLRICSPVHMSSTCPSSLSTSSARRKA